MKRKFQVSKDALRFLYAVETGDFYDLDHEYPEYLADKTWNNLGKFTNHCPGFFGPNSTRIWFFLNCKLKLRIPVLCGPIGARRYYQWSMNFVYDNYTKEERSLIYRVFQKHGGTDAENFVDRNYYMLTAPLLQTIIKKTIINFKILFGLV